MFENKSQPLAHPTLFYKRLLTYAAGGGGLIFLSLAIGTFGYKYFGHYDNYTDGFYNASMILTGMGPADQNPNQALKLFASFYALYSGVIFLSSITIVFAPIVHRFFHILHLDDND
jgi:hypothetical protein